MKRLTAFIAYLQILVDLTLCSLPTPRPASPPESPSTTPPPSPPQHVAFNFLPLANMKLGSHGPSAAKYGTLNEEDILIENITDPDVSVRRQANEADEWKTKVIIASTITATVEIVIVLIIVLYWKQIRWSFRKISCPCDDSPSREHERMEVRRHGDSASLSSTSSYDLISHSHLYQSDGGNTVDQEVTYAVPSTSTGIIEAGVVVHSYHRPAVYSEDSDSDMTTQV